MNVTDVWFVDGSNDYGRPVKLTQTERSALLIVKYEWLGIVRGITVDRRGQAPRVI